MKKKQLRNITLLSVFGILLIGLATLYLCRNGLLRQVVDKRAARTAQAYDLDIHYQNIELEGLNRVKLQGVSIVPHGRDTLLKLQSLQVDIRFWKLLRGEVEVHRVEMDGLKIAFIKRDTTANYDFLFRPREKEQPKVSTPESPYADRVDKLLNLLYGFLPENGELNRVYIIEQKDSNFVSITLPSFKIKDNHFQSTLEIEEDTLSQHWTTEGELNRETHTLRIGVHAAKHAKISVPYINRRFGASVTFDSLFYSLTKETLPADRLQLTGKARISGLSIFHRALSPEAIRLDQGQLAYRVNIGQTTLELDSASTVLFNKLQFHPYVRAEKRAEAWRFTASVRKPWFPATDLFGSLPQGLFSNLDGIQTDGQLDYRFLLDIDLARPDSLKFESELKEKAFRIVSYGGANLGKMSGEFTYTAYENGQPVRTFPVGRSWEHFTPLDSISPLLQMSVMQSEDGAFFYHRGFLPEAMREALIHDLKVKRFARGGSTISMQLVKNVFLNRNKNFARKLEEALIVWLIENERLTSKERMYEVYLNIVEWGPLIYGAHEAAEYYFRKRPSQLTAEESIFLASIIPKPKHFKHSFTESGQLKEHLEEYYRLIAERLVKKGLISDIEADSIRPDITVTGEALKKIAGDPLAPDASGNNIEKGE